MQCVVMDMGGGSAKIGIAGEDAPRIWQPAVRGMPSRRAAVRILAAVLIGCGGAGGDGAGGEAGAATRELVLDVSQHRRHMSLHRPMSDGVVDDWDALEAIWHNAFKGALAVDSTDYSVMMAERALAPTKQREKMCEVLFEKFGSPAVFLAKEGVLSCFANGRTSGLVLDMGAEASRTVPVVEGYVLKAGVKSTPVGGRVLDEFYSGLLASKGVSVNVPKRLQDIVAKCADTTHLSYTRFHMLECIRDAKEAVFRVGDDRFDPVEMARVQEIPYELPDGTKLSVDSDRFRVPELLFDPEPLRSQLPGVTSVPECVGMSVMAVDDDSRRELCSNLIVTGGGSAFGGLEQRLLKEVTPLTPGFEVNVVASPPTERRLGTFLGGSILGSLGSFHDMWFTKAEYEEHGAAMIARKCP